MANSFQTPRFWILTSLILFTAIIRILFINIPNAAPIGAIALFAGAYLTDKRLAFIVPIVAMLLSDILLEITFSLGIRQYHGFHELMPVVYGCFILVVLLGFVLRNNIRVVSVISTALISAILFFIITNFAVWAAGGYPKTIGGLIICYELAIPFFKNTIISNIVFAALLFGTFEFLKAKFPVLSKTGA